MIDAIVICDSICESGHRLTTVAATYPRFIHAEVLTHRMFSRNAASSRAVPVAKMLQRVKENPALPIHWGENQKGMQAATEIREKEAALTLWLALRDNAIDVVEQLRQLNVHKQVANRLLEPWMHIQSLISATEWENFFNLRAHPDAQPEIQALAIAIRQAIQDSQPVTRRAGDWHLPFITAADYDRVPLDDLKKISAARCARVSYYLHDGRLSDLESDLRLFERLAGENPKHLSPLEHIATPSNDDNFHKNYRGWRQFRTEHE